MPNPIKSLGYIKCHRSSSTRPVKSPSNSIRYNCGKICSWSRRPKTILKIRKKATFLYVINSSIIYKSPKPNSKFKRFKTIVPAWVLIPLVNHNLAIFSVPQADKKPSWFHDGWLDIITEVFIHNLKFAPLLLTFAPLLLTLECLNIYTYGNCLKQGLLKLDQTERSSGLLVSVSLLGSQRNSTKKTFPFSPTSIIVTALVRFTKRHSHFLPLKTKVNHRYILQRLRKMELQDKKRY